MNVSSASGAVAVTPSDSTNLSVETRAIYVGTGGNVVAIINGSAVTFSNVPTGALLPIRCTRINSTSTTASNIVALY